MVGHTFMQFSVIVLLLFQSFILIQSIECDNDCYSILLNDIYEFQQGSNIWCYEYKTKLNNVCNLNGDVRILFGINTDECYLSRIELENILFSTLPMPSQFVNNINHNGIEFIANAPVDSITICIDGTYQATTTNPLHISDDNNQCTSTLNESPDFCIACLDTKPDGRKICQWDSLNTWCTMELDTSCQSVDSVPTPCFCFTSELGCESARIEGHLDCGWNNFLDSCVSTECVDTLQCACFETRQDCINVIEGFPQKCMWQNECVANITTTTQEPTTTACFHKCSCYDTKDGCEGEIIDYPLDCIWTDECVNNTISTTEIPEITTTKLLKTTRTTELVTEDHTSTTTTDSPTMRWRRIRPTADWRRPTQNPTKRRKKWRPSNNNNNRWNNNRWNNNNNNKNNNPNWIYNKWRYHNNNH